MWSMTKFGEKAEFEPPDSPWEEPKVSKLQNALDIVILNLILQLISEI